METNLICGYSHSIEDGSVTWAQECKRHYPLNITDEIQHGIVAANYAHFRTYRSVQRISPIICFQNALRAIKVFV